MNTNDEGYVCALIFWSTSGIPLCQTRIRVCWRQLLAPHCATRSSSSERQLLAWDFKYEYSRTPVGKRWQKSVSRTPEWNVLKKIDFENFVDWLLYMKNRTINSYSKQ